MASGAASDARIALKDVVAQVSTELSQAQVPQAWVDAQLLIGHALGMSRAELTKQLLLGSQIERSDVAAIATLVVRRSRREPLQHILGSAPFRGLTLSVGPGVFVPRPETETVVQYGIDAARSWVSQGIRPQVVDLCCGSGAMGLAVAAEVPESQVLAVELSEDALAWAECNRVAVGQQLADPSWDQRVHIAAADATMPLGVLAPLVGQVHVVVTNPPYIPSDAEPIDPEVRDYDPDIALYGGGVDGLATPAAVLATALELLVPGGFVVMEHAEVQAAAVRDLASGQRVAGPDGHSPAWGWSQIATITDLTGRDRALIAVKTPAV